MRVVLDALAYQVWFRHEKHNPPITWQSRRFPDGPLVTHCARAETQCKLSVPTGPDVTMDYCGVAMCSTADPFNALIGRSIALGRILKTDLGWSRVQRKRFLAAWRRAELASGNVQKPDKREAGA